MNKNKTNRWKQFFDNHATKEIHLPYEENLHSILNYIKDKNIKKKLIDELMHIDKYDPFLTPIPHHKLSKSLSSFVLNVQKRIKLQKELAFKYCKSKLQTLYYQGKPKTYIFIKRKEDLFINEFFALGVHFVFVYIDNHYKIYFNPNEAISVASIYKELSKLEPDTWKISLNSKCIYTEGELHSHLSFKRIMNMIEQIKEEGK